MIDNFGNESPEETPKQLDFFIKYLDTYDISTHRLNKIYCHTRCSDCSLVNDCILAYKTKSPVLTENMLKIAKDIEPEMFI